MTSQTYDTGVIQTASNAYAFIQPNGATNAGFIVSEEGIIVIDFLMTPSLATRLLSEVRNISKAPMHTWWIPTVMATTFLGISILFFRRLLDI